MILLLQRTRTRGTPIKLQRPCIREPRASEAYACDVYELKKRGVCVCASQPQSVEYVLYPKMHVTRVCAPGCERGDSPHRCLTTSLLFPLPARTRGTPVKLRPRYIVMSLPSLSHLFGQCVCQAFRGYSRSISESIGVRHTLICMLPARAPLAAGVETRRIRAGRCSLPGSSAHAWYPPSNVRLPRIVCLALWCGMVCLQGLVWKLNIIIQSLCVRHTHSRILPVFARLAGNVDTRRMGAWRCSLSSTRARSWYTCPTAAVVVARPFVWGRAFMPLRGYSHHHRVSLVCVAIPKDARCPCVGAWLGVGDSQHLCLAGLQLKLASTRGTLFTAR